jgi:2-phosphosulfolactate phosphatase
LVEVVTGTPSKVRGTVVIVDVMRSSTAIAVALSRGAKSVVPCKTIDEAKSVASRIGSKTVLAGERYGIKPQGFDVDISPVDFMKMNLKDKKVIYTSTNLTRVLARIVQMGPRPIVAGGLINAKSAAAMASTKARQAITIVACGLQEDFAIEDFVGAGAIASYVNNAWYTDSSLAALLAYRNQSWRRTIMHGRVATYLKTHLTHLQRDFEFCLQVNVLPIAPVLKHGQFVLQ